VPVGPVPKVIVFSEASKRPDRPRSPECSPCQLHGQHYISDRRFERLRGASQSAGSSRRSSEGHSLAGLAGQVNSSPF
jgi:hypothetical protein